MKSRFVLTSADQVRALTAPLRRRILEVLARQPMTTKQVAERLGQPPTRLYHHVAALEAAGLIELVEERRKRGTVERYYQSIAREFAIDRRLFAATPLREAASEVEALFGEALLETQEEIRQSLDAGLLNPDRAGSGAMFGRIRVRGSAEQMHGILGRLQALMEELRAAGCGEDEEEYGLTIAFYPIAADVTGEGEETERGDAG